MRSDRNPYFLYKNKQDPHIQHLLAEAPKLTDVQIFALTPKPDLRKAMQFVRDMGAQTKSVTTAELIADQMHAQVTPPAPVNYELWCYKGPEITLQTLRQMGSIKHELILKDFLFLLHDHVIWVSHNWCKLPEDQNTFWPYCEKLGTADHTEYNRQTQVYLTRKYQGFTS